MSEKHPLEQVVDFLILTDELATATQLLKTFYKYSLKAPTIFELDLLGRLFSDVKAYPESIEALEYMFSLAINPEQKYNVRSNLAKLYNNTNQPEKALEVIACNETNNAPLNIQIMSHISDPTVYVDFSLAFSIDMLYERVFSYFLLNDKKTSENILKYILENVDNFKLSDDDITRAKFNMGTYNLYRNKFQEGLRGFMLEGKKIGLWQKSNLDETNLVTDQNPILSGDKILVVEEAGIGDSFMNIRFMNNLKELGVEYYWLTNRRDLSEIYKRSGYSVINSIKQLPEPIGSYKLLYSMSAPLYLNLNVEDLWQSKYITLREPTDKYVFNKEVMKIGLRWSGNPHYEHDLHRSIPLADLYNTVKLKYPDAEYYSLQVGDGIEELSAFPDIKVLNITDFDDTLEILSNMDLVVTTCTSIVHAAGAIGVKTNVFVPISAYYCWCTNNPLDSTFNHWYPSVSVFRQVKTRSWKEAFDEFMRAN